jgi:hypothetical protein
VRRRLPKYILLIARCTPTARCVRLDSATSWCAGLDTDLAKEQVWVQVDLGHSRDLVGILLQGGSCSLELPQTGCTEQQVGSHQTC